MGFRRLRGRIDQVHGAANDTIGMAKDLIADLQDGFSVTIVVDAEAARSIFMGLLRGEKMTGKIELPISLKIDPTVDTKDK